MAKAKKKASKGKPPTSRVLGRVARKKAAVEELGDRVAKLAPATIFTQEKKAEFLELYKSGLSVLEACAFVGVSNVTVYNHKRSDPKFCKAFDAAMDDNTDALEDTLHQLARKGNVLAIFGSLKARRPAKWRENFKIDGDVNHAHNYVGTAIALSKAMGSMEELDDSDSTKAH